MPVCSNCGGSDFVWADNLKTGGFGRGGLSLRSGGELALGTRVCRSCGHADLFVKDPTVLRQPHTWKPGEFVPITPRSTGPGKAPVPEHLPPPAPPASTVPVPLVAFPTSRSAEPSAPASPGTAPSRAEPEPGRSAPAAEPAASSATAGGSEPPPKKPARRRSSKPKAANPPVTHE